MSTALRYLYKIFFCILFCVSISVWAQDPHPTFKEYNVEDGLASSKVYQVKQDSKGYIWFATNNGISRFNGYEFENFSMSSGLTDNTMFEIFEDKKGKVWFLSLANELSYYENGTIYPYLFNDSIQKYIPGNYTKTSFCVNEKGSVFIGFYQLGMCEISSQGKVNLKLPGEDGIDISEPMENILVYANKGGISPVYHFDFKTKVFSGVVDIKGDIEISRSTRMIRLKNKSIAMSVRNRMYMVDTQGGHTIKEFPYRINWLYEDREGILWVGTHLGGVFRIDHMDFENKACYLSGLSVTGVLEDNEGGFWFTTEGNSVYYTPSIKILTYDKACGIGDDRVNCVATDHKRLYLGLQNGEIHSIMPNGVISQVYRASFKDYQRSILTLVYEAAEDRIWYSEVDIRNGGGYCGIIKDGVVNRSMEGLFTELLPGGHGVYWLSGPLAMYKIVDYEIDYSILKKVEQRRINAILYKNKEVIFVGTLNGLWEYNTLNAAYTYLGDKNPLLKNRVMDLAYANDSTLIIGTKGAGLLLHYAGGTKRLTTANGLSSNNVFKILVDDSLIWLGTDRGLNRLIYKNGILSADVKVFNTLDGLASNEIADMVEFDRRMWVATDRGLSCFDISGNEYDEIPVYMISVSINDSLVAIKKKYHLGYLENNISLRFIALSYRNAKNLTYRYRMEGLDTNWLYTRNRDIQYTTLPPGNYTFEVAVLNANGTWSKSVKTEFSIPAPFWETWWFLTLTGIIGLLALFYAVKYWIVRRHEKRNKEDEINRLLLQLKLKALRAQMNPHFVFNVLSSIQHFILFKHNEAAHHYLSKFSTLIRTILNNSDKNMVPLSEEIKALTLYLDLENMRLEKQFGYEIHVDKSIDSSLIEIPSMLIQPYVENAVKHGVLPSLRTGIIRISIGRHEEFLKCTVEDNGVGRAFTLENKSSEYRSFGTAITKERLSVINELYQNRLSEQVTDLYDKTGAPAGTRVEIYLPSL